MLYKPKNIHPKLGSDQPIIYLDQLSENGTVDFTYDIDGDELIETAEILISNTEEEVVDVNTKTFQNIFYQASANRSSLYNDEHVTFTNPWINGNGTITDINFQYNSNYRYVESHEISDLRYINHTSSNYTDRYRFYLGTEGCYNEFTICSGTGQISMYYSYNPNAVLKSDFNITQVFDSKITNYKLDATLSDGTERYYVDENADMCGSGNPYWFTISSTESIMLYDSKSGEQGILLPKDNLVTGRELIKINASKDESTNFTFQPFYTGTYEGNNMVEHNKDIIIEKFFSTNMLFTVTNIKTIDKDTLDVTCSLKSNNVIEGELNPEATISCKSYSGCNIKELHLSLTLDENPEQYLINSAYIPAGKLSYKIFIMQPFTGFMDSFAYWKGITGNLILDTNLITQTPIFKSLGQKTYSLITYPSSEPITYSAIPDLLTVGNNQYYLRVNRVVESDMVSVQICETSPTISIDDLLPFYSGPYIRITGKFTSISKLEKLNNYQWKLYRGTYSEDTDQINGNLIYQTSKIYSQDFQFEYDNLISGEYVIEAIVEDNYGQIWSKREPFEVNYEQNDLYLNLQSELDKENTGVKLKWDKPIYGVAVDEREETDLALTEDLFTLFSDEQLKNYKTELVQDGILNLCYNKYYLPKLTNKITFFFEEERYLNVKNTNVQYFSFLGRIYLDPNKNMITMPIYCYNDTDYWNQIRIQKKDNIYYHPYIQTEGIFQERREFEKLKNVYKGLTTPAFFDFYCQYNFKLGNYLVATKVPTSENWEWDCLDTSFIAQDSCVFYCSLSNISNIDYIMLTEHSTWDNINEIPILGKNIDFEKENSKDTIYLNFNSIDNIWNIKDPNAVTAFNGYKMKRYNPLTQKVLNMGQYYFTSENTEEERRFVDYSLPHNEEVKYLIYPQGNEIIKDEEGSEISQELIFSPIYSDSIKGDWDKWCLFTTRGPAPKNLDETADNGYNENVLLVDKVFFFEMNVETGSMKNNTDFSVVKNFTPYPHIQRSPSNYWSGQLKGLLGRLAIDDCTFKQTPTMLQEIKELTQNTSRKFLKDRDGNFWEVELSSDITIDNNDKLDVQLKTKSFNWVEVGDASDIALVSVGPGREDWLLTELGQEQIDISRYTWDENAIWDDNDFWTESE